MFRSLLLCVSSLDKTIMNLLSFIWFNAYTCLNIFFFRCGPTRAMTSSFLRFLDHTQRRATFGRTPLGEWSARRRDIYLTTQTLTTNIHVPDGIRTHDLSKRAATDPRLRPRGYWDRPVWISMYLTPGPTITNSFSQVLKLTFWRRNYFFLILAHLVYKMWIIQEPNTLELWNKLHFEEEKMQSIHDV